MLNFQPDKPLSVPFNYQYQLQSAIYAKLGEIGASEFWHDVGFGDARKFKPFTFSPLKGKYTVSENKIRFHGSVSLELRSPVFSFCDDIQRSLELNPVIRLFDTNLIVTHASVGNLHINRNSAVFKTESPVLICQSLAQGQIKYFSPDEEEFYVGICNNFERKYEAIFNRPPAPIQIRRVGEFKKVVTRYKRTFLTAYQCSFEARGDTRSLEFIYNTGAGSKNPQGFGFVSIF